METSQNNTEKSTASKAVVPVEKTTKAKATKSKKIKVTITGKLAGKFFLPYKIGQNVELEEKQANTLMEAGYAMPVKK